MKIPSDHLPGGLLLASILCLIEFKALFLTPLFAEDLANRFRSFAGLK
jgi:hypothetical protein